MLRSTVLGVLIQVLYSTCTCTVQVQREYSELLYRTQCTMHLSPLSLSLYTVQYCTNTALFYTCSTVVVLQYVLQERFTIKFKKATRHLSPVLVLNNDGMFRDAQTMRLSLSLKTRPVHVLVFKYSIWIIKAKDGSQINVLGVVRTVPVQ